jgi:hypothetical protein
MSNADGDEDEVSTGLSNRDAAAGAQRKVWVEKSEVRLKCAE